MRLHACSGCCYDGVVAVNVAAASHSKIKQGAALTDQSRSRHPKHEPKGNTRAF